MDDRQKVAVELLAAGVPLSEVADVAGRDPRTVFRWLHDPGFQAAMIQGIRASALLILARNLKSGGEPKEAQAALATLRWLGAGKPGKPRQNPKEPVVDEDADLGEFSEESLQRLKGDD